MKNFNETVTQILTDANTLHNINMMYSSQCDTVLDELQMYLFDEDESNAKITDKEYTLLKNLSDAIYEIFAYNTDLLR